MRFIYLFPFLFLNILLSGQTPGGQMYFADVDVFNNPGPGQGLVRYLSCGDIDITSAITMEAWVRFAIPTDNQKVMGKVDANGGAFFDDGYLLGINNSRINPEIWTPTNQQFTEGFIPPVSIWHHIAVTYAVGGDYKAYLDGNLVYEQAAGNTNIVNDNTDFIIGIAPWDLASFMSFGSMDEIRLWEVARTEDEIRYGMFRNLNGFENGLVLYMNFDNENGNPTIADLSAAGNDCSKNNMDETNFIESDCVIGNAATQMMQQLAGIWFASNPFLQDPRVVETSNGLSLSAQFNGQDTSAYVVWGDNDFVGVTSDDLPADAPANAQRSGRIWEATVFGQITPDLVFNLTNAAGGGATLPTDKDPNFYTLLERAGDSGPFTPVQAADSKSGDEVTFQFVPIQSRSYAIAVGDAPFDISGVSDQRDYSLQATVFPNPNTGRFTLSVQEANFEQGQIWIYNSLGQLVRQEVLREARQQLQVEQAGWYSLLVQMGDRFFRQSVSVR